MRKCCCNKLVFFVDPPLKTACLEILRCTPILDLMAVGTLYGVMAFSKADLQEVCRFAFDFYMFF